MLLDLTVARSSFFVPDSSIFIDPSCLDVGNAKSKDGDPPTVDGCVVPLSGALVIQDWEFSR